MTDKKILSTFNSIIAKQRKYKNTEFHFEVEFTRDTFFDWYLSQNKKQENCCYYCGVNQQDITTLIQTGKLTSKRFNKRGKSLEIERIDSKSNQYSPKNCVLICYFCNNDKSDVISSEDYIQFFVQSRKNYIHYLLAK